MRLPILDITQRLYLNGKKILRISTDSSAARSSLNLIDEKAIKDYVDASGSGGGSGFYNLDGGSPSSIYLSSQLFNGGSPSSLP